MSNGISGMEDRPVVRTDAGGVATLTLNRPRQFNAMSEEVLAALQAQLDAIAGDESVRVVVIAANGAPVAATISSRCGPIRSRRTYDALLRHVQAG
ncbi:MAG: enoyl-CoA hydratase/isomerase family protein [Caldilineaceae bacterium]